MQSCYTAAKRGAQQRPAAETNYKHSSAGACDISWTSGGGKSSQTKNSRQRQNKPQLKKTSKRGNGSLFQALCQWRTEKASGRRVGSGREKFSLPDPARRWSRSSPARFFDRPNWPRAWNRLRKWGWIGHTLGKSPSNLPNRHWTGSGIPKEREKLVGPGRLGEESRTMKWIKAAGMTWVELKRISQTRVRWWSAVAVLCSRVELEA